MNKLSTLILLNLITFILPAQDKYVRLDSLLEKHYQDHYFSGVVLVAEGDHITYAKAWGYADYQKRIPLNLHTAFDLSSGAKLFCGVALAQLVDQEKVDWKSKVHDLLPDYDFHPELRLDHLLTHSSGLGNFHTIPGFTYDEVESCGDILPWIAKEIPHAAPGDSILYATSNLIVLGAVVEKLSGMTYPTYVQKRIIEKLDLKNTHFDTYFDVQDYPLRDARYARGYVYTEDSSAIVEKNRYPDRKTLVTLSAGGMWSSAQDLFTFDRAVFSDKLFSKEVRQAMMKPYTPAAWENVYFGYIYNTMYVGEEKECWGHAGNSSGHHSFNFYYPKFDTTLIVLTNYGFCHIFNLAQGEMEPILFQD